MAVLADRRLARQLWTDRGNEEHLFFLETTYSNNMHTFTNQTGPAFTTHCCHSRTLAILEILLRVEDSVVQLIQNIGTVRCAV